MLSFHRQNEPQVIRGQRARGFAPKAALLVAFVGVAVYANTLRCPFVFDDLHNIHNNPHIKLRELDVSGLYGAAFDGPTPRRPVAKLSFALNYYIHQGHLAGYHVVNIAIHILNGFLVCVLTLLLLRKMVQSPSLALAEHLDARHSDAHEHVLDRPPRFCIVALIVALVFIAHPIQSQAVTYIVQRMASMAAMFYLAAFVCYMAGRDATGRRRIGFLVMSAVCWSLAIGCKENAATLPVTIGLYEWFFMSDLRPGWLWRRRHLAIVALVLVAGVFLVYLSGFSPVQEILEGYRYRDYTLAQRVLTQFRVVVFYLTLVVLPAPSRLNVTPWISSSDGILTPATTALAMVVLTALFLVACLSARRHRLLSFGLIWMLLHLVIESSAVGLEMVYEHRMYLPMVGVAFVLAAILMTLHVPRRVMLATACLAVVILGSFTHHRNKVWSHPLILWNDVVRKNVDDPRSWYNRGHAYESRSEFDQAIRDYRESIWLERGRLKPYSIRAYNNLGNIYVKLQEFDKAIDTFNRAIEVWPRYPVTYNNRAGVHQQMGELELAKKDYDEAIKYSEALGGGYALAYYNRGLFLAQTQQLREEAIEDYSRAIEIDPNMFVAYINRGNEITRLHRYRHALQDYERAVEIRPNSPEAVYFRGICSMKLGDYHAAIEDFRRTIQFNDRSVGAYDNLAWIRATCPHPEFRNGQEAVGSARRACELSRWKNYRYIETLAAACAEAGEFENAIKYQRRAVQAAPPDATRAARDRLQLFLQGRPYHDGS